MKRGEIRGVCPDCGQDVLVLCTSVSSLRIKAHTRMGHHPWGTATGRQVRCRVDRTRGRDAVESMRDLLYGKVATAESALTAAREAVRAYGREMVLTCNNTTDGRRMTGKGGV